MTITPHDLSDLLIAYETGGLSESETVRLFQHLLDTGLCWQLQGHYGRTATALILAGFIHPPKETS